MAKKNGATPAQLERMMKGMPYISEHLSSLRQEIVALRNMNARSTDKSAHSPVDQSALEQRAHRLREIKQELSKMLNNPDDPTVWWDRVRKPKLSA